MLDLAGLKKRPDILAAIDLEMTPQKAFEAYQIKSAGARTHRNLPEIYFFYLSLWKGERKIYLLKKGPVEGEIIAEVAAPPDLLNACADACEGQDYPRGQCPLDEPLKDWLRVELNL